MNKKKYEVDWEEPLEPIILLITPESDSIGKRLSFDAAKKEAIKGIYSSLRNYVIDAEREVRIMNELKEEDVE